MFELHCLKDSRSGSVLNNCVVWYGMGERDVVIMRLFVVCSMYTCDSLD